MKKPAIGRIVIIKDANGEERPAIIHHVWNDTCVNVTYFTDGGPVVITSCVFGDGVAQWQWPVIQG